MESLPNQQRIFSKAVQQLLAKARLRLSGTNVDFARASETERTALIEQLQKFDCVVLLDDFSPVEIKTLKEAGVRVVESRHMWAVQTSEPSLANRQFVSAVYTGVVPIVYKAQRALLENLIQSSFWSFITITPLMMLVSRSISGGAVAMLPNALPVLVVFGGMGWLGIPIDIGSMMSASIALGVAVDDTIHFLTWYREDLDRSGDRHSAIVAAYRRCAPPTLQAALISGLGLSVFALSTFTPTQRLGWLMMTILLAGVVAELVMLPAILAGPLGKAFPVRARAKSSTVPAPHIQKRDAQMSPSRT